LAKLAKWQKLAVSLASIGFEHGQQVAKLWQKVWPFGKMALKWVILAKKKAAEWIPSGLFGYFLLV